MLSTEENNCWRLVDALSGEKSRDRCLWLVLHSDDPRDLDVAVFQDSDGICARLSTAAGAKSSLIPLDIIASGVADGSFLEEVEQGRLYEMRPGRACVCRWK
jgi:hypothetical protein